VTQSTGGLPFRLDQILGSRPEASWRTIRTSPKWERIYERIKKRAGAKRAIVAVARKLLCVIHAMLRTMTPYRILAA